MVSPHFIDDQINRVAAVTTLQQMIANHGQGRITATTAAAYTADNHNMILITARSGSVVIGIAGTILTPNQSTRNTICVVSKRHRRRGIGTVLMQSLLMLTQSRGHSLTAVVADDNVSSNKMCNKAQLRRVGTKSATRSSGSFVQIIYHDPTGTFTDTDTGIDPVAGTQEDTT